jgi:hypothetical protein
MGKTDPENFWKLLNAAGHGGAENIFRISCGTIPWIANDFREMPERDAASP